MILWDSYNYPLQQMQRKRVLRSTQRKIPPFHTLLIQQYIQICEKIKISLTMGSAQINGIQLKKNYPQYFSIPCSLPVYSWQGAQILIQSHEYENTVNSSKSWVDITIKNGQTQSFPMTRYLQIHYDLLNLRKLAFEECRTGPRVAIVGSDQAASQNISRLLLNYSGKYGMDPIFVDLDPENTIFIDGSIGALEYQYKIMEDLYDRPNKLSFYYGNRSTKSKTYLTQVKYLADCVMKKLNKQIKDYKLHGSKDEYPSFSAGLIIQFPKYKPLYSKKQYLAKIKQILLMFECTHVINVAFPEIEQVVAESKMKIKSIKGPILQGTQSFLNLPRPLKSKIERYFNNDSIQIKYNIDDITIYELMTENGDHSEGYCRVINIRDEAISKNTVAILHAVVSEEEKKNSDLVELYQKATTAPIACLARIFNIGENQITLEVAQQHFLQAFRNNIWVTSATDQ